MEYPKLGYSGFPLIQLPKKLEVLNQIRNTRKSKVSINSTSEEVRRQARVRVPLDIQFPLIQLPKKLEGSEAAEKFAKKEQGFH